MLQQLRASTCRVAQCWCVHEALSRVTPLNRHILSTACLGGSLSVGCGFYSRDAKSIWNSVLQRFKGSPTGWHSTGCFIGGEYSGSSVLQSLLSSL